MCGTTGRITTKVIHAHTQDPTERYFLGNGLVTDNEDQRRRVMKTDFYVGAWHIQPRLNRISGKGVEVQVEPKVIEMLVCLAEHPGEPVTREDLHAAVWPGVVVGDKALTGAVSKLRKIFDDDPRDPQVIETISKTGYRLIAPMTASYAGDASPDAVVLPDVTPSLPAQPRASRRSPAGYVWLPAMLLAFIGGGVVWTLFTGGPPSPSPSPAVPFTTYPGHELYPALSPDGRHVAFVWGGAEGTNWDVYVRQAGAETPLRLTRDPGDDLRPVWSPDGTQVAFQRYTDDTCDVLVVPALSGPVRRVASCFAFTAPERAFVAPRIAWSPDAQWLAMTARRSDQERPGIYLFSPETQAMRKLTTPTDRDWADVDPAFSPDGTDLAFGRYGQDGSMDLYVVSVADGRERRLTTDHRSLLGHSWTPDGRHLVFSSDRGGTFALWTVPASGGSPAWIPASGAQLKRPTLAEEGRRLIYEDWRYDTNIWRLALAGDTAQAAPVIASTRWDVHPAYAPEGTQIAFVSDRSGSYEVWLADADGANPWRLTALEDAVVGIPRWSPDGRYLVFDVRTQGRAALYRVEAAGGTPRRLTPDASDNAVASWSPDGAWLYFASNRSGTWQIWKMPPDGGAAAQVTGGGGYAPQASPDGQFVYYAKMQTGGLWRVPVDGGAEEQVLDTLSWGDWGHWALTDGGVYFVRREGMNQAVLAFFDEATTVVKDVAVLDRAPLPHQPGLALSPDGRWLLYVQLDRTESDLMLLENAF